METQQDREALLADINSLRDKMLDVLQIRIQNQITRKHSGYAIKMVGDALHALNGVESQLCQPISPSLLSS